MLSEVDTDTLKLIPNVTPIPVYNDIDVIKQAVGDIVHILQHPTKNNIPTVLKGDAIKQAFREVAILLNNDVSKNIQRQGHEQTKSLTRTVGTKIVSGKLTRPILPTKSLRSNTVTPTFILLPRVNPGFKRSPPRVQNNTQAPRVQNTTQALRVDGIQHSILHRNPHSHPPPQSAWVNPLQLLPNPTITN